MLRTLSPWTMYFGVAIAMASGATWPRPTWAGVIVGLVVIAVGIVFRKLAGAPPLESHMHVSVHLDGKPKGTLVDAVEAVPQDIEELLATPEIDLERVKTRVEQINASGADRFGASQEALAARVGFAVYAEIMAPLATAERLLYRAWSAAADGHREECINSLKAALPHAKEAAALAREKLNQPSTTAAA